MTDGCNVVDDVPLQSPPNVIVTDGSSDRSELLSFPAPPLPSHVGDEIVVDDDPFKSPSTVIVIVGCIGRSELLSSPDPPSSRADEIVVDDDA